METKLSEGMNYCRKCTNILPSKDFYDCTDAGFIDSNMKFSVCKECTNKIYDELLEKYKSMEKALHKMCTSLNVLFSNEAVSATKAHINTLLEGGKKVNAVFGIYKQKLIATQKSMDKSTLVDMTYEDVGTIFTSESIDTKEIPVPQEIIDFWGKDIKKPEIEFLEMNYANFKQTHKADTYAEITLLKQVCYTLLDIKQARAQGDTTEKLVKELQELMKNLAISPNAINANAANKGTESYGLWIADIERYEPCEWLLSDPRGDIYRDVADTEGYFKKYVTRPGKNFIMGSKDFNLEDEGKEDDDFTLTPEEQADYKFIDDGETDA